MIRNDKDFPVKKVLPIVAALVVMALTIVFFAQIQKENSYTTSTTTTTNTNTNTSTSITTTETTTTTTTITTNAHSTTIPRSNYTSNKTGGELTKDSKSTTKKIIDITAESKNGLKSYASIKIDKKPKKLNYYFGDTPSIDGIVVKGVYSNGKSETIPSRNLSFKFPNMYSSGNKEISVKYGSLSKTFSIKVNEPKVEIYPNEIYLSVDDTYTLEVESYPANQKIEWKSASSQIASVNQNGMLIAKDCGVTTVMAVMTYNGLKYYSNPCLVSVKDKVSDNAKIYLDDVCLVGYGYSKDELINIDLEGCIGSEYPISTVELYLEGFVDGTYTIQAQEVELDNNIYSFDTCELNDVFGFFDISEGEQYYLYIVVTDIYGGYNLKCIDCIDC